jgi:hypothetical protein
MKNEPARLVRTSQYKGRPIRAASFQVGPEKWVSEACFWVYTEKGFTQLWTKSFEHLLGGEAPPFPSQKEADRYAFRLAELLIDKTVSKSQEPPSENRSVSTTYPARKLKADGQPFSVLAILKEVKRYL